MTPQKRWGIGIAAVGVLLIAYETLVPGDELAVQNPQWCLLCGYFGGVSFILNVVLFVPLGVGLRLAGVGRGRTIIIGFLTCLAIEILQFDIIRGRESGISDLVSNTLGTVIGLALAERWRTWLVPDRRTVRWLARAGALAWLAIIGASAWALQASAPAAPLRAFWIPDLANFARFPGRLLSATLDGVQTPDGEVPRSEEIRRDQVNGRSRIELTFVAAQKTAAAAPIFGVWNEHWVGSPTMGLLVCQEGTDLTLWLRMRSSDALLRNVILRLTDVLPSGASGRNGTNVGDTVFVQGVRANGRLSLRATVGGQQRVATLPLTPALGWNLLLPFNYPLEPGGQATMLGALWLAGLLLPVGFWSGRAHALDESGRTASRGVRARHWLTHALTPGAAIVIGLLIVPAATHLAAASVPEWLAAAVGVLSGWSLGWWTTTKSKERVAARARAT